MKNMRTNLKLKWKKSMKRRSMMNMVMRENLKWSNMKNMKKNLQLKWKKSLKWRTALMMMKKKKGHTGDSETPLGWNFPLMARKLARFARLLRQVLVSNAGSRDDDAPHSRSPGIGLLKCTPCRFVSGALKKKKKESGGEEEEEGERSSLEKDLRGGGGGGGGGALLILFISSQDIHLNLWGVANWPTTVQVRVQVQVRVRVQVQF
ncbi:hypothetical protein EYF80_045971 [Liparis tanakae]|uniref:Uncharacterized protein n=1 Tax=Liparis tanakae TaxID=230148 RepID=A0A4Z2FSI7_9TELE|nr:hypothetical protein EYF80_045971 [Liparis tanakae]